MKKQINLKTLKDIPFIIDNDEFGEAIINYKDNIKAEAVKCAKYYYEMMQTSEFQSDYFYFKGRYDEIIERNDLTEENLK